MEEVKLIRTENPDSIEIGTPSKGGAIKVYGNADNKAEFEKKIKSMIELRVLANKEMGQ